MVHEVTIYVVLIVWLVKKLTSMLEYVETAFLYGEHEEAPKGFVLKEDECLLLQKAIYGLVQGRRQWRIKLISILKK